MIRCTHTLLLATGLFVVTLFAGGCQSSIDSSDLRSDWTPELLSTSMSTEQYMNANSRHRHNTWRQLYDDWSMIWLQDRNLNLTQDVRP